jgi:N-acetylneuraminic acid mutarotase
MLLLAIGGRADASTNDIAGTYEVLDTTQAAPAWSVPVASGANVPGYYDPAVTWHDSPTTGRILMFSSTATVSYTGVAGWQTVSPPLMPTPRDAAGAAAAANGRIYVIGGGPTGVFGTPLGTVEAYDPSMNKWATGLAPLPTPRTLPATAVGTNGLIYAIGGTSAGSPAIVGTVEAYDTVANQWSTLSEIPEPAIQAAAVGGPDGRIYVIGGSNDAGLLSTVNAFSPATNRWTPVVPIDSARFGVGAVLAPDGRIWAVGGSVNVEFDGFTTVEIYGPVGAVNPQSGAPGGTASVTGSNFAANASVSVYISSATGTPLATGTTNSAGMIAAPITFTVPNITAGQQPLIIVDDRSQYPITLSFRVQ